MATKKKVKAIPDGYHTVTPNLTVDGADRAIEWYRKAFHAEAIMRAPTPDGKVMHAEIAIGNSRITLHDPMMDGKDPKALGGNPTSLMVYVEDCDGLYNQALAAGATVRLPMGDQFWGDRMGGLRDPFGYDWMIATHKEDLTPEELARRQEEFYRRQENK